jgi:hypothetical protein
MMVIGRQFGQLPLVGDMEAMPISQSIYIKTRLGYPAANANSYSLPSVNSIRRSYRCGAHWLSSTRQTNWRFQAKPCPRVR